MDNLFDAKGLTKTIDRINSLSPDTKAQWGKMSVSQMLAHCCVTYEMAYENKHPKPNAFAKMLLKLFVKNSVVGPKPYPKNGRTAPAFIIKGEKDFEVEKGRLIDYLKKTKDLGASYFADRDSHSFGPLTIDQWNTMFSKHLDHHLTQFGV